MRRILSIVLCLMLSLTAAFPASTQGTDFWLTFMRNLRVGQCTLIASSASDATVTVSNPVTLWSTSFTVPAGQTATCQLPLEQCYLDNGGTIEPKGLHITSTAPIDLFAANVADYTYDATLVLPTSALGTNYIIQTYEDKSETAELAIVATMPNTSVAITPHAQTKDGHVPNVSYSVALQPGEAYQVLSFDKNNDFSGTYIHSDKPVAVFAGHACANVPATNNWCDHLVEQQSPTSLWGKQFAITKTVGQQSNRVMITAKENNTIVQLNGTQVAVLQALQTYSFRLTDNSAFVQTSEPVACFLYIEGARSNNLFGDPSSVTIMPIEQRTNDLTFSTFQTNAGTHNINVVTTAAGVASMKLNGHSIASSFAPLDGNNAWHYARLSVSQGTHTLRSSNEGFVGYIYGMGYCESYAYPMGSSLYALNIDETGSEMGGFPYIDMTFTDAQCYRKPIHFTAYTNIDYSSLTWDFGDGQTASGLNTSHTYAAPGAYTVTLTVSRNTNNASITRTVLVSDTYRDTIHAEICEGETYLYEGTPYTTSGVYTVKQSSLAECDSLVMLDLTAHPTYHSVEYASFPRGASYGWHDQRFRSAGIYRDTIPSVHGCDSTFELHLTTTDPTEIMYDTICYRPTYYFHGYNYPLPSVEGFEDREFINYTLAYADKYNCKTYRIHLAIIPGEAGDYVVYDTISSGQSYTWHGQTYTSSGTYTKTIGDNACLQHFTLHLYVSPFPIESTDSTFCHADTIFWHGHAYTDPGIYYDTLFTVFGIERIHRLQLSDNRSFTQISVQDVTSYDFHGRTLTHSGTYRDTLVNAVGCDSIVSLHLDIFKPCENYTEDIFDTIIPGQTYLFEGTTYTEPGDYNQTFITPKGCDSVLMLHLILNPLSVISMQIPDQCADSALLEFNLSYSGVAHAVRILFDDSAHTAGLQDAYWTTPATITSLPNFAKAGDYTGTVELLFRNMVADTQSFAFSLVSCSSPQPPQPEEPSTPLVFAFDHQVYCWISEESHVMIYDVLGRLLLSSTLNSGKNTFYTLDAPGVYVVLLTPKTTSRPETFKLFIP